MHDNGHGTHASVLHSTSQHICTMQEFRGVINVNFWDCELSSDFQIVSYEHEPAHF